MPKVHYDKQHKQHLNTGTVAARDAPTVSHRGVGDKCVAGVPYIKKIRGRENISVGTWNRKLEELINAKSRHL